MKTGQMLVEETLSVEARLDGKPNNLIKKKKDPTYFRAAAS